MSEQFVATTSNGSTRDATEASRLVAKIKKCEECIARRLEGLVFAFKNCAERTKGKCEHGIRLTSHGKPHTLSDVVAFIEWQASMATRYEEDLHPDDKADKEKEKNQFDMRITKIKEDFVSCTNNKANCKVTDFEEAVNEMGKLPLMKVTADEEELLAHQKAMEVRK